MIIHKVAVVTLFTGMIAFGGCGSDQRASYAADGNNIETMRAGGHPVPPSEEWWVDPPSSAELIESLVEPLDDQDGLCSGRLWLPRGESWKNVDVQLLDQIEKRPTGSHQLAMCAHFHAYHGDSERATVLMKKAKAWFFDPKRDSRVYCTFRSRHLLSALLSLDWIRWSDEAEFERAFELLKSRTLAAIKTSSASGRDFYKDGYWNATHPIESAYFLEQLLALSVCGVNPQGESDLWARGRLASLDNPTSGDTLYSTFRFSNVLSLLSRRGGGREYGQNEGWPGIGGYEQYFSAGGIVQIEAVDTATGRKWKLRERNLYLRTRYLGLITEIDHSVAHTHNSSAGDAFVSVMARFYADEAGVGGLYQWSLGSDPVVYDFRELQTLAGPAPKAVPPPAEPLADRVASRWHYRADPSQPDSTFRMWITNRDLENFRISPDERCLSFCIGNIGLVDGHANRTRLVGGLANGVHLSGKTKDGGPWIADANYWPGSASHHPYWSPDRAKDAEPVLRDPRYLVGTDGPVEQDGVWTWHRDYTPWMTRVLDSSTIGKVSLAQADYRIQPDEQRLEIVDTIRTDSDVYVGWHFSPSHEVTLEENGFSFGDGKDKIVVHIEGLDGLQLQAKRRSKWQQNGYTLPLDWHETKRGAKRIAENIGYTPTKYQAEYKVRVVIQANPDD